jgi:hypothetical protein
MPPHKHDVPDTLLIDQECAVNCSRPHPGRAHTETHQAHCRVSTETRLIFIIEGERGYDKLITATASRTFFPPMEGMWGRGW